MILYPRESASSASFVFQLFFFKGGADRRVSPAFFFVICKFGNTPGDFTAEPRNDWIRMRVKNMCNLTGL